MADTYDINKIIDGAGDIYRLRDASAVHTVDQSYNASSTNPQSGTAVAQAISGATTYSAGSYIDITNNVISNTMHADTTGLMVSYNTLANAGVTTHRWGPWCLQITKKAMANWDASINDASIEIRFAHSDYLDGSIVNGSVLTQTPYMWKDADSYTTSRWGFTGAYSSGPTDGWTIALEGPTDPDNVNRALSRKLRGYHFNINCGMNAADWLECKIYPMYINANTAINTNGARLLIQAKYFYA